MTLPLFPSGPLVDAPAPELRPYQERAVRLARMHIANGKRRILLALPTGGGKMVLAATIIHSSTVPALFVCHRMELVDQCAEQLARQGITNIGVMRGDDDRENASATIQIASIQTLARRVKPKAGLILIDEAHRAAADSYVQHIFDAYPDAIILGFTASPCRSDGKPLGSVFEVLEVVATYAELLKRPEWLVEPDCYSSPIQADISQIQVKHGDFEETALGEVMSQDYLVGNLLDHWLELSGRHPELFKGRVVPNRFTRGDRRRTFIFAVNIKHSRMICERFARAGVRIAHLDGTTPEDERRAMLLALRKGDLECISNCNVLLEGVDAPEVKCVLHARPTWSLVLWMQSTGRIFRPWNSVRPLILDHAGNFDRHGPPHEDRLWSLTTEARRKSTAKPIKLCRKCFAYVPLSISVCPYCSQIFTTQEMQIPRETGDHLALRDSTPEAARKEFFDRMAVLARVKGYKPGYASAKHKERYGDWPPREWGDTLKQLFATDAEWKERLTAREGEKQKEEKAWNSALETKEEIERAMDVGDDPAGLAGENFSTYQDGEETFSAWTRRTFLQ